MIDDSKKTKAQLIKELDDIRNQAAQSHIKEAPCEQFNNSCCEDVEEFRDMVECVNDAIAVIQDNVIKYANNEFKKILGYQDVDILETPFTDYIDPQEIPQVIQLHEWTIEGVETLNIYRTVLKHKNGSVLDVEINNGFMMYKGNPAVIIAIRDINDRIQAEKALEKAHIQNKLILESIASILIGLDSIKRVTHWNTSAENTFKITAEDIIGKPFHECNIQWDWDKIVKSITESHQEKEQVQINDFRFMSSEHGSGFLNLTITPFWDEDFANCGSLLLGEDITRRKILEDQLNESYKLESVGRLAAGIAHEINTPTQFTGDNTRFLEESFADILKLLEEYNKLSKAVKQSNLNSLSVAEVEKVAEEIDLEYLIKEIPEAIQQSLNGLQRIAEIVLSIKEFSQPELKEKSATDLNQALKNVITVTRNEWKYVAEMETDFDPDLPIVSCFINEINQVILNLIINAAHAITEAADDEPTGKGIIKITTRKNEKWIEILISDTGPGIPEEIRNNIFEPFFTTKEVGKGTGQGLATSFAIVKKHNGNITFETEMGKGTTFIIRLPIES